MPLLSHHQDRIDRARRRFFPKASGLKISRLLRDHELPASGLYKLRITYGEKVEKVSWEPYQQRKVETIRVVEAGDLRYTHKYADRAGLEELYGQRNGADDILIVQHGYLTDTSYANIALFDGRRWFTPACPLLRGVRRAELLARDKIEPSVIRLRDLPAFRELKLFNAMISWAEAPRIPVARVLLP